MAQLFREKGMKCIQPQILYLYQMDQQIMSLTWLRTMGPLWQKTDFTPISLSASSLVTAGVVDDQSLEKYIQQTILRGNAYFAFGGYLEKRELYSSSLFHQEEEPRNIHLGVDIWAPSHTPIFAPRQGVIHSFAYNATELDYGYTLILHHVLGALEVYSLYGHLSSSHMHRWKIGATIEAGELIGHLGPPDENGGWLPHVHLQLIYDLQGMVGDYPGVCSHRKLVYYQKNCPNPLFF